MVADKNEPKQLEELTEIDFSAPLMTTNGYLVKHRPDLFVIEGTTGRHSVVDKYGRTTLNKIKRVWPVTANAEELRRASERKHRGDPIEVERKRQERKAASAAKEKARAGKEKDRLTGLKKLMARIPANGVSTITPGRAATQIAKYSGESQFTVFWWLVRISKNQPDHPARAYMVFAGTDYMELFNPGKLEADNTA